MMAVLVIRCDSLDIPEAKTYKFCSGSNLNHNAVSYVRVLDPFPLNIKYFPGFF